MTLQGVGGTELPMKRIFPSLSLSLCYHYLTYLFDLRRRCLIDCTFTLLNMNMALKKGMKD